MRNRVPKHQTAKRVSEQYGVVIVLAGFSSCDGEFFNRCQNAVRRCDRFACALAVPECKELQSRCGKIRPAPRNVNTDNIDLRPVNSGTLETVSKKCSKRQTSLETALFCQPWI